MACFGRVRPRGRVLARREWRVFTADDADGTDGEKLRGRGRTRRSLADRERDQAEPGHEE